MSAGGVHSTRLHGVSVADPPSVLCHLLVALLVACKLSYSWWKNTKYSTYLYRMLMRPTIMGAICVDVNHAVTSGLQVWQQYV
jgi:hypothetical protein